MATRNPRRKLRQDGTVAWQARYRDRDGRQRAKEFTKKVDAERFLATTRADMARGDWINPADAKRLFADVAEHWRTTQVHADTTAAAVAGDLRNHILPTFGDREIGRIRHSRRPGMGASTLGAPRPGHGGPKLPVAGRHLPPGRQ